MEQYKNWIALERSKGIGIAGLQEIYAALSSASLAPADIFDLSADEIKHEFNFSEHIVHGIIEAQSTIDQIEDDYADLLEAQIQPILFFESAYPAILHQRLKHHAPPIIYTLGNINLFQEPAVALLGDQDISPKGEMIDYQAAKILTNHNILVISGMAKGAGTIAHRSSRENGGKTIGVLPCGLFQFKMSAKLMEVYNSDDFLIISSFYPKEPYSQYNAMIRNRLICALAKATYIVEAPLEGGIFEAGKSAQKIGVPLFTTQYAEYPPSAEGNKKLITELKAQPIRGKKEGNILIPNLDTILALTKFTE